MRQLHIFSIKPKLDVWLLVDFCVFPRFYLNLPELNLKLFWTSEGNNFRFSSGKYLKRKTGKNTEINNQSQVKFWFNRKKPGAVSYLLSCIDNLDFHPRIKPCFDSNHNSFIEATQRSHFLTFNLGIIIV